MNDDFDETSPCGVPTFSFQNGSLDADTGESVIVILLDAGTGTKATLRMSPELNVNVQIAPTTTTDLIFRQMVEILVEFEGVVVNNPAYSAFTIFAGDCSTIEYFYPVQSFFNADNTANDIYKTYVDGGTSQQFSKMQFNVYSDISFDTVAGYYEDD